MNKTIYKIRNRKTGAHEGAYSRAYHTEYEFESPEQARSSNVHNIFKDKSLYKIERYRVVYQLMDSDVDKAEKVPLYEPPKETPQEQFRKRMEQIIVDAMVEAMKPKKQKKGRKKRISSLREDNRSIEDHIPNDDQTTNDK